jgi:histidinol phosphatase-like PHP family hydrolase
MFTLSIAFGPASAQYQFNFKTKEAADKAYDAVEDAAKKSQPAYITDDHGSRARIANIHGCIMEDLDAANKVRADRWLMEQRTQAKAMQAAHNDPVLKTMAMMANGGGMGFPGRQ